MFISDLGNFKLCTIKSEWSRTCSTTDIILLFPLALKMYSWIFRKPQDIANMVLRIFPRARNSWKMVKNVVKPIFSSVVTCGEKMRFISLLKLAVALKILFFHSISSHYHHNHLYPPSSNLIFPYPLLLFAAHMHSLLTLLLLALLRSSTRRVSTLFQSALAQKYSCKFPARWKTQMSESTSIYGNSQQL